jgi:hypothetical protein
VSTIEQVDYLLSVIDIILCLVDIGLIVYLFFYRFPPEKKKRRYDKFAYYRRRNRR